MAIDEPWSEADDAISFEKKPDGSEWLHVHVAGMQLQKQKGLDSNTRLLDTTGVIQLGSPLDLDSRRRTSSIYFPHRVYD